jgi:hypothetical protein
MEPAAKCELRMRRSGGKCGCAKGTKPLRNSAPKNAPPKLEVQTAFTGRIGKCLHATMVAISTPVEDDVFNACFLGA